MSKDKHPLHGQALQVIGGPDDGKRMVFKDLGPEFNNLSGFDKCSVCGLAAYKPLVLVQWVDGEQEPELWCEACWLVVLHSAHRWIEQQCREASE